MGEIDESATWAQVLSDANQLLKAVRGGAPKDVREIPTAYGYILGIFWRVVSLYEGSILLLAANLPEEAAMLARSLFEESLRLRQLAEDGPTKRDALILHWVRESIKEQVNLLKVAAAIGLDNDLKQSLAILDEKTSKLNRYRQRRGVTKLQPFLQVKDAAKRFQRNDDYWTYQWSHEAVHGSDASMMFRRKRNADGTVGFYGKTANPRLLVSLAGFAAVSVADAANAAVLIFEWPEFGLAKEVCARIKAAEVALGDS